MKNMCFVIKILKRSRKKKLRTNPNSKIKDHKDWHSVNNFRVNNFGLHPKHLSLSKIRHNFGLHIFYAME